ncbi:MAG: hypothetical protein ABF289_12420 [Clostridiales bacterium]
MKVHNLESIDITKEIDIVKTDFNERRRTDSFKPSPKGIIKFIIPKLFER